MGEALLARAISALGDSSPLKRLKVESAGVWGEDGMGATREAVEACAEVGVDLSSHVARTLNSEMLKRCFALLAMTRAHLNSVKRMFPENELPPIARTFNSFVPDAAGPDIQDPWGCGMQAYINARGEIMAAIPNIVKFLEKELSK